MFFGLVFTCFAISFSLFDWYFLMAAFTALLFVVLIENICCAESAKFGSSLLFGSYSYCFLSSAYEWYLFVSVIEFQ